MGAGQTARVKPAPRGSHIRTKMMQEVMCISVVYRKRVIGRVPCNRRGGNCASTPRWSLHMACFGWKGCSGSYLLCALDMYVANTKHIGSLNPPPPPQPKKNMATQNGVDAGAGFGHAMDPTATGDKAR